MTFEWDEAKNRTNLKKHGLDFEFARLVFSDPLALLLQDPSSYGEGSEIYRIVSVRRATAHERKTYEES